MEPLVKTLLEVLDAFNREDFEGGDVGSAAAAEMQR
jgi:hypothetical protein